MKKLIGLVFVFGVLAAFAPAQIVRKGNTYLFRMKFTKGSVVRYKITSTVPGMGGAKSQPMKVNLPMVWSVLNVQSGIATIQASVGPVMVGQQKVIDRDQKTVKIDSRGQSVGDASDGQQITPPFPLKPIKVGDKWNAAMSLSGAGGAQGDVNATYKFVGVKNVGGKQLANIAITLGGTSKGTGSMQLLVSDGTLFSSHVEINLTIKGPDGSPINRHVVADITRS